MNVCRRVMYDQHWPGGQERKGLLREMEELGICWKGSVMGRPMKCWCAWENHLELFTMMKARKGEPVLGRIKKQKEGKSNGKR
jgi:hypothetical protein